VIAPSDADVRWATSADYAAALSAYRSALAAAESLWETARPRYRAAILAADANLDAARQAWMAEHEEEA